MYNYNSCQDSKSCEIQTESKLANLKSREGKTGLGRSSFSKTVARYHDVLKSGNSNNTLENEDISLPSIYRKKPELPEKDKLSHYESVFSNVLNPCRSGCDLMRTKSDKSVFFSQ